MRRACFKYIFIPKLRMQQSEANEPPSFEFDFNLRVSPAKRFNIQVRAYDVL